MKKMEVDKFDMSFLEQYIASHTNEFPFIEGEGGEKVEGKAEGFVREVVRFLLLKLVMGDLEGSLLSPSEVIHQVFVVYLFYLLFIFFLFLNYFFKKHFFFFPPHSSPQNKTKQKTGMVCLYPLHLPILLLLLRPPPLQIPSPPPPQTQPP